MGKKRIKSVESLNRTKDIVRRIQETLSYTVVAPEFGITRERVRQYAKNAGIDGDIKRLKWEKMRRIQHLKKSTYFSRIWGMGVCDKCGKEFKYMKNRKGPTNFCSQHYGLELQRSQGFRHQKEWVIRNKEYVREKNRKRYDDNREKILEHARQQREFWK